MKNGTTNKSQAAFDAYCADPVVQRALEMAKGTTVALLLKDCFMAGAKYATERCRVEHHTSKPGEREGLI